MLFSLNQIPTAFLGTIVAYVVGGPGTLLAQMYTSGIIIDSVGDGGSTEGNYSF